MRPFIAALLLTACTTGQDIEIPVDTDTSSCTDPVVWYADTDGDGHGDYDVTTEACDAPVGYVALPSDCDDGDDLVNPDVLELCGDGVDNDCDGAVDDVGEGASTWVFDGDGDGFGAGAVVEACDAPVAYVELAGDCDDDDDGVHPGATEVCDGVDNDCDDDVDEDLLGTAAQCAADRCDDVGDGVQWLGGAEPFQAVCDDGWMLIDIDFADGRTTFEAWIDDGHSTTAFAARISGAGIELASTYYPTQGSVAAAVRATIDVPIEFTEARGDLEVNGGGSAFDTEDDPQWGMSVAHWTAGAPKADGHFLVGVGATDVKGESIWGSRYYDRTWSWDAVQCGTSSTIRIEHSDEAGRGVVVTDLEVWVR